MTYRTLRAWMQGALAALVLAACGGGSEGGIGGTGSADVSQGTITAFGSVWVNGVEFETSTATTIRIDDNPHPESDLRVGMVARVDGSIAGASASAISVETALKGRVESLSGSTQMVVMGQTVLIDGATVFENSIRPAVGDYVEVHGLVVAGGQIAASFVERKTTLANPPFVVHGIVANHVAGTTTFTIGVLTVNAQGAAISDLPAGSSWNGLQVEVKGSTCAGTPPLAPCGVLTASKVERDGVQGDVAKIEVEGFVTSFASAASFTVGSQPVVTTAATVFEGGVAGEIVLGAKLEVEGSLAGGVITATKVSFRENIRFEGNAANVNAGAGTFALVGLPGITIEVNALTRFSGLTPANLAGVANGQHIEVRGRPGAGNNVVATEVKAGGGNTTRVILQAVASAVAAPNVTLLGIVVDTSPMPDAEFKDINDSIIGRTAFFQRAAAGTLIKARGTLNGATVVWDQEIQLED